MLMSLAQMPPLPDPVLQEIDGMTVVRDDLLPGGTKRRVAALLFDGRREVVYASPAEGFAQVALGYAAADLDLRATIVVADRKAEHRNTRAARRAGAEVVAVRPGYLTVVTKRARDLAAARGAHLVPFGFDHPAVTQALTDLARRTLAGLRPPEVWTVAGSGVMTRALQAALPGVPFHAVQIGRELRPGEAGRARVWVAPEQFGQDARLPPPFPSCANYDAKAWRFMREHAQPGALFWNVAA